MEKRRLEKLGIETSLLGFGCMRFPQTKEGEIDEVKAQEMLDQAIAEGVNYIDTAYPYHGGKSEPFVGRALKKYDRGSYYLATKLPVWMVNTVEDAKCIFEEQLERLQTDYIDFYLLHAMGRERWEAMVEAGVVTFCEQLKKEGKIRYFGFSFHDGYDVFEEILNYRDWDFCQIQYNYMDTDTQAGDKGYALTKEKGIPLIIMEPIKGGSLAVLPQDMTDILRQVNPNGSTASMALRWVGSHSNVKVILSGMSSMEQTEDNLETFSPFVPLSEVENKAIETVKEMLTSRVQNSCTGCRYCMPCPAGVNIPGNFRIWNTYHSYENYNVVKWEWENQISDSEKAHNCIQCGKCEKACPQKIAIREDLQRVQIDLDKKEMIL